MRDHATLTNKSVPVQVRYNEELPENMRTINLADDKFSYEGTIDRLPYITRIEHQSGAPLLEWLEKDMEAYNNEYYGRIDRAVNAWLDRVKSIRGAVEITKRPNVEECKQHFIWFCRRHRTCLSVGVLRLKINPFSFQKSKEGYGYEGIGLAVPRNVRGAFQKMIPTAEEYKVFCQYRIDYEIMGSKEVIIYKAVQFYQRREGRSEDDEY